MKKLTLSEANDVSGGTSNLQLEIPPGFRLLFEAIAEYASFPKEFAHILENRSHFEQRRGNCCRPPHLDR